jgi:hypothetical protein
MDQIDAMYCRILGIENPYKALPNRLSKDFPRFDRTAFKLNPRHQFVYDKLFVARSQHLPCGELQELERRDPSTIPFPIFIKPRYGHLTSSSKNCYKIKSFEDLAPHWAKPDMMWSTFVAATEGMTDFVVVDGSIVYQLTYKYSDEQTGFADVWKYIDPNTPTPQPIVDWVQRYMTGYTGPFNVQYRATTIIEVGMRFARTGMYIESTGNAELIAAMNDMWTSKAWLVRDRSALDFRPFYSFKCWSPMPIIYLLPQHLVDLILRLGGAMPFYEYYFEPTGTFSTVFFQFLHRDFDRGMQLKRSIERTALACNVAVLFLLLAGSGVAFLYKNYTPLMVALLLYMTSLDNSLVVLATQLRNQQQFLPWGASAEE